MFPITLLLRRVASFRLGRCVVPVLLLASAVHASKVTVDADGVADYTTLDDAISDLETVEPDTVLFIGNNQDTFTWSQPTNASINTVYFIGQEINPDQFPVIIHSEENTFNFFNSTEIHFENMIVTTSVGFITGHGTTHSFKNCIFRDGTDDAYIFFFEGSGGNISFSNCLFENNTTVPTIFSLNYWGGTPTFTLTNCTFDNNSSIFDVIQATDLSGFSFSNCIFSNNTTTFSGDNLRGRVTYSLTSESVAAYGTGCDSITDPQYVQSSRSVPSDWRIAHGSPAQDIGTPTGAPAADIGATTRLLLPDAGCWEATVRSYTWDTDVAAGFQGGNGTWGTDDYWSYNGTGLLPWPDAGTTARFADSDGSYAVTVSGTRSVDSIAFDNSGYTLTGGTISLAGSGDVAVADGKSATIASVITGSAGLSKQGNGTLILTGTNTFTGGTTVQGGVLQLGSNGTGGIVPGTITNNDTLIFSRSDDITFAGTITGTGDLIKAGDGTLSLTASNDYSGTTRISAGTLLVNGTLPSGGDTVTVDAAAALGGTGTCDRTVVVAAGGSIIPGNNGAGRLTTGDLTLANTSQLHIELGASGDTIAVDGDCTVDGILHLSTVAGFTAPATYRILTCTGTITYDTLSIGTGIPDHFCGIISGPGYIDLRISTELIIHEPADTTVPVGATANFTVAANGAEPHSYEWYRYPSDGSARSDLEDYDTLLSIASIDTSFNGDTIRCFVTDNSSARDTTRAAVVTVIDTPRITLQPVDTSLTYGEDAQFTTGVADTATLTYAWKRIGSNDTLSTTDSLVLASVTFSDSADSFYCLLSNLAATVSTDTAVLTVDHIPPVITTQPASDTVTVGSDALFTVAASGTAAPVVSWKKTGDTATIATGDSLTISATSFPDSGYYYCIASNPGGQDTSDTAFLMIVPEPPSAADAQPDTVAVTIGSTALFIVTATGTEPFSYEWYAVVPSGDSLLSPDSDSLRFTDVTFQDGGHFFCIVSNGSGSDTSDTVTLIAGAQPPSNATVSPSERTIRENEPAVVTVSVSGTGPFSYEWYRTGSGSDSLIDDQSDSLVLQSAALSDSGWYYCVVTNAAGSTVSDTAHLIVLHLPPVAAFSFSPHSGPVPLSVDFTNASTGAVTSYTWLFGDGDSATTENPSHDYMAAGTYSVTCIVSGPGGSDSLTKTDSLFVYAPGDNPVQISTKFLSGTAVEITLSSIDAIDTTPPAPQADSLGLWIKASALPDDENDGTLIRAYDRADLTSTTLVDTIDFPDDDSLYGCMSGLFWNDGTVSSFTAANGSLVLLRDTLPPANNLSCTVRPAGGDSIEIRLTGYAAEDTSRVDSLILWYGTDSATTGTSGNHTRSYGSKAVLTGDTAQLFLQDTLFSTAEGTVYIAVFLKGTNGRVSEPVFRSFTPVADLPENPLVLSAMPTGQSTVRLSWLPVPGDSYDSVCIWYGTGSIPTGVFVPSDGFTPLFPDVDDAELLVEGLSANTGYTFAIILKRDDLWSPVTDSARTGCTTLSPGEIGNGITIDTLFFDSLAASLRISWCIDSTAVNQDLQVGITYSLRQFPTTTDNIDLYPVLSRCTDTLVRFREPLLFDTLYYVALWLRRTDGTWLDPTADSRRTVRTGKPFRQKVTFFDTGSVSDTVAIFNGDVFIWKDSTYDDNALVSDTVEIVVIEEPPEGFVTVGTAFRFRKGGPVLPFYIGIRIDSLPDGITIDQVRMYTLDRNGICRVDYGSQVDTENGLIYIKTSDLENTFIALVDTVQPDVVVQSDTASGIATNRELSDTLDLSDNISNMRWYFLYSKGDERPELRSEGTLDSTAHTIVLTIPSTVQAISSESGLRALLVVSDGVHFDTVNLSRSVFREESDGITTKASNWTPVYATGMLEKPSADSFVTNIAGFDTTGYDTRYLRLFRWVSYDGNRNDESKWVEFDQKSDKINRLFSLAPGMIVWLKTRRNVPLHLGDAYTLSLKEPFTVALPPNEWIDFGMPFRFGVSIADIFAATGSGTDSILIAEWQQDSSSGTYILEPLYTPGIPGKEDASVLLSYRKKGGYCFFNLGADTIALNIPPTLSEPASVTKRKKGTSWSVVFTAATGDGGALPRVYCGYAPSGAYRYPVAPSFSTVTATVFDRPAGRRFGHTVSEEARNGLTQEILLSNTSDSLRKVSYRCVTAGTLPETFSAFCYNPETGNLHPAEEKGSVVLAANASASRWIVAGDAHYLQRFSQRALSQRFMFHPLYPNPVRSQLTIRYTLPLGSMEKVQVSIYNILGKRIWERQVTALQTGGTHTLQWDGRDAHGANVGSGLYIVSVALIDQAGVPVQTLRRNCTLLR